MEAPEDPRDIFYIARAETLNSYALLEQALALLFATTLRTEPSYASLIISKIINTRARNEVVQRIVDHATELRFRPFTNSLFVCIATVDSLRNQLVHWHVEEKDGQFSLKPADILSQSQARMSEEEIDELGTKCLFLAAVTRSFSILLSDGREHFPASRERFQQPLVYPPGRDDPLFRYHISSGVPPEPFAL
jgi:hypothetical protein